MSVAVSSQGNWLASSSLESDQALGIPSDNCIATDEDSECWDSSIAFSANWLHLLTIQTLLYASGNMRA